AGGAGGRVIGVDPSVGMLQQARASLGLPAVLGVGEALPLASATFDFLSMGYALRHLPDLRIAFAEFHRVLRPGGRLCILEISRPAGRLRRQLMGVYFRLLLPMLARTTTSSPQTHKLWGYYWETIDQCVPPDVVMQVLRDVGFDHVGRNVSLGMFSEFVATKRAG
ncbi:MAG: class I SAM-dependent methyltransferase, partial [Tepidisphaeraceae bacterium]